MALKDNELRRLDAGRLFPIAVEEIGEVLQAIGKTVRFGPKAIDAKTGKHCDNIHDLISEFEQLTATMHFLMADHGKNLHIEMDTAHDERNR